MVKKYVILSIILVNLFSGCLGDESIAGKYVYEENPKGYFILYDDGTFNEWFSDGSSASGTYRYENNRLTLTFIPFGNVKVYTKDGDAFINDSGGKYVKE
ncbi:MAG TPA: hypothetical protein VN368_02195 [Candidatus Methylomirabilis sp.]|nr:hypothetical protein [Candidatus Methylomirabilis sp.]